MKREEIKAIFPEASDEQLKQIMDLNGADVEKFKTKVTNLETELKDKGAAFENLSGEFEKLKSSNATAEDYKTKFEQLQNDIAEKEKTAKEEKEKAEREANILSRYNAVAIDKDGKPLEWSHEAIKADYLHKFTEELSNKENEGKSDADIFKSLTENDGAAFKVPSAQNVFGGADGIKGGVDEAAARAVMGLK